MFKVNYDAKTRKISISGDVSVTEIGEVNDKGNASLVNSRNTKIGFEFRDKSGKTCQGYLNIGAWIRPAEQYSPVTVTAPVKGKSHGFSL